MHTPLSLFDVVLGAIFLVLAFAFARRLSHAQPFPPGPRPIPILGNLHQMSAEYPWKLFRKWNKIYGDIVFLRVFNTPMLVINSQSAARDLLEKQGTKYSDRPHSTWLLQLLDWDLNIGSMPYGVMLRRNRRWLQAPLFDKASLRQFLPLQARTAKTLLLNLLNDPDNFRAHLHRFAGSLVLEVLYGHSVTSSDDEYLALADKVSDGVTAVTAPGIALLDFVPVLRHLPAWFPGGSFQHLAKETKIVLWDTANKTYDLAARVNADKHTIIGSVIKEYQGKGELSDMKREIMSLGAGAYTAGTDTTKSTLQSFVLAMVLHPEVLAKAQREMDDVIGTGRLPTIEDRPSLPYLDCILKETWRWASPAPLSVPHATSTDDVYRGYFIPKGTVIVPNIWFMLRDPDDYPEPDMYIPDRYMGLPSETAERIDPRNIVFGHGRRICPARRFADNSVWIAMAHLVATFDFCKAKDALGNEITPQALFHSGLSSPPLAFQCTIKPRSAQAAELIRSLKA